MSTNSINNEISDNDLSVFRSSPGIDVFSTSTHSDNTNAASNAVQRSRVGGAAGGDPSLNLNIAGASEMSLGLDNSDGDALKLTTGSSPSLGTVLSRTSVTGETTQPLQPSFRIIANNTQSNDGSIAVWKQITLTKFKRKYGSTSKRNQ